MTFGRPGRRVPAQGCASVRCSAAAASPSSSRPGGYHRHGAAASPPFHVCLWPSWCRWVAGPRPCMLLSKTSVRKLPPARPCALRPGHTYCSQGYSSSCTSPYVRQPVSFMLDLSIESVTILERQLMNMLPLPYFSLANVVATSCMHACSIYLFKHTVPAAIVSQLLFQKLQRHVCMVELITEKGSFEPMER
jgi:hypothetical protein